jgi:hypothetical protein
VGNQIALLAWGMRNSTLSGKMCFRVKIDGGFKHAGSDKYFNTITKYDVQILKKLEGNITWSRNDLEFDCSESVTNDGWAFWISGPEIFNFHRVLKNKVCLPYTQQNAVCIHFRCSDGPFDRMDIKFNTRFFYADSRKFMNIPSNMKVIILHCGPDTHYNAEISKEDAKTYTQLYLKAFIKMISDVFETKDVQTQCSDIDTDFNLMVQSKFFICAHSSLSIAAALLRIDSTFITSVNDLHDINKYPSHVICKRDPKHTLQHHNVQDYWDVDRVLRQLEWSA